MMLSNLQLQTALYQIAIHIGSSTNSQELAKDAVNSIIRQLNCVGAILCHENTKSQKIFFSMPKSLPTQEHVARTIEMFCAKEKLIASAFHQDNNTYFHPLTLPGFGTLILLTIGNPLDLTILRALRPICQKLSNALITSLRAEKNQENMVNFKMLIDTMSEGFALFDQNLTCLEMNTTALDKLGYTYEEALKLNIYAAISKDDHDKLHTLIQQDNVHSEWTLYRKDGTSFPALVSGVNTIHKGKFARIVTFWDLTELKTQEKHLYNHSRLAQMGEMIAMIAHQWRQPLGAISASVIGIKTKIMMQKFDLDSAAGQKEQTDYLMHKLDTMSDYVEHLSTTIEDFRNFFKPNKEKTSVNLEDVIQKALNIVHPALLDGHVHVEKEISFKHPIETYNNEILQALLNLFKNAIDHFEEEETLNPMLFIKGYEQGTAFIIEISDNGGGIPEHILDKIFDPYFSTKEDQNGTGLGLYMTKTMIEDHCKGSIVVKNIQKGAHFTIILSA